MPLFIQKKQKVLFLHIPKTGGTTVEEFLEQEFEMLCHSVGKPGALKVTPQHLQESDLRMIFNGVFWDYSFAIVRNPYDRIESEYFYRTKSAIKEYGKRPGFSKWVLNNIANVKKNPYHLDNHLQPQCYFIEEGTEVFYFEDGFPYIMNSLIEKLHLINVYEDKKKNASERKPVEWSIEARLAVNEFYVQDFQLFDYEVITPKINTNRDK